MAMAQKRATMAAPRSHLARPPYVDPTTNIIYDTDNAEYEGWLTKQSMWLKVCQMKDIFFGLTPFC